MSWSTLTRETQVSGRPARLHNKVRARGVVLLTCGTYGNVIRLRLPLITSDKALAAALNMIETVLKESR